MKAQAESRQTLVLGVYAREFPGGLLKLDPAAVAGCGDGRVDGQAGDVRDAPPPGDGLHVAVAEDTVFLAALVTLLALAACAVQVSRGFW